MFHIIVNPTSRTGKGKSIWAELEPVLVDRQVEYKVIFSKRAGHVISIVRELCNTELIKDSSSILKIIVLGGDGTLNETLQGISDFSRVQIGYIPTGSSNDMARDLHLPKDPVKCLNNIIDCKAPTYMDIGCLSYNTTSSQLSRLHEDNLMSKRYFDVSCGIGYDAAICEEALASPIKKVLNKFGLGKLVYLCIALKQLLTNKPTDSMVILDDTTKIKTKNFLFIACMIHQYEGGGFMFCPDADYHDGLLDICLVGDVSKLTILRALPSALKGQHYKYKGITRYHAKKIEINTSSPCWIHTDGEVTMKTTSVTVTCEKEALMLLK